MPRRALAALAAALVTLVGLPAGSTIAATPDAAISATAVQAVSAPPPTDPGGTADNPFVPEDKDLTECVSAVPKPGCGSEARGGWRQGLVFAVLVVGLGLIGWRITRAVRRNRQLVESPPGPAVEEPAGGRRGS